MGCPILTPDRTQQIWPQLTSWTGKQTFTYATNIHKSDRKFQIEVKTTILNDINPWLIISYFKVSKFIFFKWNWITLRAIKNSCTFITIINLLTAHYHTCITICIHVLMPYIHRYVRERTVWKANLWNI